MNKSRGPDQFRAKLKKIGLVENKQAARALCVSTRTITRWANGKTKIPGSVWIALDSLSQKRKVA
jgi:hypothetical protein